VEKYKDFGRVYRSCVQR